MARAWLSRLSSPLAAALVVAAYVFFATAGTFDFRHVHVGDNYRALAAAIPARLLAADRSRRGAGSRPAGGGGDPALAARRPGLGGGDVFRARSPKLFEQLAGSLSPSSLVEFPRRMGCYRRPFSDLGGHDHAVGRPADPAPSPETCSQRCREL